MRLVLPLLQSAIAALSASCSRDGRTLTMADLRAGPGFADLAIYCVNWGFRLPARGMDAPVRPEIANDYGRWLAQLQFRGEGYRDGAVYDSYGIVFVPDPYEARPGGE